MRNAKTIPKITYSIFVSSSFTYVCNVAIPPVLFFGSYSNIMFEEAVQVSFSILIHDVIIINEC
jgi:hypothetical protein